MPSLNIHLEKPFEKSPGKSNRLSYKRLGPQFTFCFMSVTVGPLLALLFLAVGVLSLQLVVVPRLLVVRVEVLVPLPATTGLLAGVANDAVALAFVAFVEFLGLKFYFIS